MKNKYQVVPQAASHLAEIEKLNAETLEYLKRHPSQIVPAEAA